MTAPYKELPFYRSFPYSSYYKSQKCQNYRKQHRIQQHLWYRKGKHTHKSSGYIYPYRINACTIPVGECAGNPGNTHQTQTSAEQNAPGDTSSSICTCRQPFLPIQIHPITTALYNFYFCMIHAVTFLYCLDSFYEHFICSLHNFMITFYKTEVKR